MPEGNYRSTREGDVQSNKRHGEREKECPAHQGRYRVFTLGDGEDGNEGYRYVRRVKFGEEVGGPGAIVQ